MGITCIIYGPTAVGKSSFAERLVTLIPCEIINGDAAQFYTPLRIGTAKPEWRSSPVPHHMFDICTEPVDYSVAAYREQVAVLVHEILTRGKMPLIVGGSGFYMSALFFPVHAPRGAANHRVVQGTWEALQAIDPVRAAAIHPNDTYRIMRALSLYQQSQMAPSQLKPVYCPITAPFALIELLRNPDELIARIEARVHEMIASGWIAEVEVLLDTPWEQFLLKKKWIGYPELIAYCRAGKPSTDLPVLIKYICRRTWHYARKQMAYARMLIKKIKAQDPQVPIMSLDLTSQHEEVYLKQLVNYFNHLQKGFSSE